MGEAPEHLKPYLFKKGERSGNAASAARGRAEKRASLGKGVRKLVGEDGEALTAIWWSIANDPMRRDADRLRATELLADRGWGKAASFTPQEGDPLGLEAAEEAATDFRRSVLRLASAGDEGRAPGEGEAAERSE